MVWKLIESDRELQQLLADHADCDAVMVDTEFMRRNTFYPQVALVQLCFEDGIAGGHTAWLVDPLKIEDTSPLVALLGDPRVLKVLHSPSEDLEVFQHWLGVLPQPLFDTQRAAALLNRGFGMGYRALVHSICDVDLPKGETRSNWLQRPLTDSQCQYAGLDVTWLLPVWRELYKECLQRDRLDWVLSDGRDAIRGQGGAPADYHTRIKTAWKLRPRQLAVLVAISRWREDTARRRDKPRNWIIDDKACLELAQTDARTPGDLASDVELPAPVLRRHGQELLDIIQVQNALPREQLPEPLPPPLNSVQRDRLKKLKSRARLLAESLSIAPEALLQSKDYERLLRQADGEEIVEPGHWHGWREREAIAPLRAYLEGAAT